jgi:DNA-binding CsgD family transcriptional regulator/signal transduction protein with GAF and PtsI domain
MKQVNEVAPKHMELEKEVSTLEGVQETLSLRLKELSAINALARVVTAKLSLDSVVKSIYEQVNFALSPDLVLVYLVQEDKLVLQKSKLDSVFFCQNGCDILQMGQCLCGLVARKGKSAFCKDIHSDPRCTLDYCMKIDIISFAAIPLRVDNDIIGVLGVASLSPRDFSTQAEFLESLAFQIAIALHNATLHEQVKDYAARLQIKNRNIEETNSALKVLLRQREADKSELEENVLSNVKEHIEPFLEKLKDCGLSEKQKAYVDILESHLKNIISPFSRRISCQYLNLTPAEIQIAKLVKQGRSTKEIAGLLNLSPRTISFHRENIRHKLGIKNQKANLTSHLQSLADLEKSYS